MTTCVIYARVSTVKQAEKELPIQSQIDKCWKKAESLGAEIQKVFTDEGISGASTNRPAFNQSITYCETFDVDYFICWSTSRFARDALEAKLNKRRLVECGTQIIYVSQHIEQNDSGFIFEGVLELFDEYFSRQVAEDTKRSMIANAQRGYYNGGFVTYGYQLSTVPENPKKSRLVPNPLEIGTLKRIFELKLNSYGGKQIAELMNGEGRLNRGKRWTKTTVLELLRNERVAGRVAFGKKSRQGKLPRSEWVIVDSHEPVIDPKVFDTIQEMMDKQTIKAIKTGGSAKSTRLFTGILKCGKCGQSMKIERAKGATKIYYYYNCGTKKAGNGCENRRINVSIFDPWMVDVICEEVLTESNLKSVLIQLNDLCGSWAKRKRDNINDLVRQITELQKRNSRLYEMLEDDSGVYDLQDLAPRLRSNNDAIKKLSTALALAERQTAPELKTTKKDLADLSEVLVDIIKTSQNPSKVREFFKTFIDTIELQDDEIKVTYRPEALVASRSGKVPSKDGWLPLPDSNGGPAD